MRLTSQNIKQQEFKKAIKGFDKDEVNSFIEKVADEFEEIESENEKLKKENETFAKELEEYKKIEKTLQETLMTAQENTAHSIDLAKQQTESIIKEAEEKAEQIIAEAKGKSESLKKSIILLKEEQNLFTAKLKALINSQLNLSGSLNEVKEEEVHSVPVEKSKLNVDINNIVDKIL